VASYRNGEAIETVSHTFTTLKKAVPTLNITAGDITHASLGFDFDFTDADGVGNITKIELLHGDDQPIVAENVDVRLFENLLSGNDYIIQATVTYDLNDGVGVQTLTSSLKMTTTAYQKPKVVFDSNMSISATSLQGSYTITDKDGKMLSVQVELFKGDEQISTADTSSFVFDGLTAYTTYTIEVVCSYDLLDGKGVQTVTAKKDVTTAPELEIQELRIIGNSVVALDGTIQFQVALHNPENATITSLVVNGHTVASQDLIITQNQLHFKIINNGQFGGGEISFVIEKVSLICDEKTYTVTPQPTESPVVNVRLGTVKIKSFGFVDQNLNPLDVAFLNQSYLLMLKLENPDGYDILNIDGQAMDHWTKLDAETYVTCYGNENSTDHENCLYAHSQYYKPGDSFEHRVPLRKITADVDGVVKEITFDLVAYIQRFKSNSIQYISTPEDLMNLQDGYYYQLTQDIDLSGIEWKPMAFTGYLDGNGYAIKNMSIVEFVTPSNITGSYGLFSIVNGTITNLHIESASIALKISGNYDQLHLLVGLLTGGLQNSSSIMNCSVDAASSIVVDLTDAEGGLLAGWVGGLIGNSANSHIRNCVFEGDMLIKASTYSAVLFTGGISGNLISSHLSNCLYNGRITTDVTNSPIFVGGIVGRPESMADSSATTVVTSCINLKEGTPLHGENAYGEAFVDSIIVQNNHSVGNRQEGVSSCTVEQLNDKSFWTDTLGWDETIWNFDDLDYENGKIPTLRRDHK